MYLYFKIIYFLYFLFNTTLSDNYDTGSIKHPTVFTVILVRNKAAILPYFLTTFTQIDYPKNRISVWLHSDHNQDSSPEILRTWSNTYSPAYHFVNLTIEGDDDDDPGYEGNVGMWTESRFRQIIRLREEGFYIARQKWADYVWFLDCDVLLTNPNVLKHLISKNKAVIAPMLRTDTTYSNFWAGMTKEYYYNRTAEYMKILNREKLGCYQVPMVHSAVLVDLRTEYSDKLSFSPESATNYDGPVDDIITFAVGAKNNGIALYICNDLVFGYTTVPLGNNDNLEVDKEYFVNLKLHISIDNAPIVAESLYLDFIETAKKTKYGFDEIYVINLERRKDRRKRMEYCFNELGLDVTFVNAIDGKKITDKVLKDFEITLLPEYLDPHHNRPMKKGEIGCFLSHYIIWQKILEENHQNVLILEDDVRFENHFLRKLWKVVQEMRNNTEWDLIYIGRKIMNFEKENYYPNSKTFVYPDYTYWTLGYIINLEGVKKLIEAKPLKKIIPVDEFLPIMFDRHPNNVWKSHFPNRNLRALSVHPLIISPMKYLYEDGYVSDTENSEIVLEMNYVSDTKHHLDPGINIEVNADLKEEL